MFVGCFASESEYPASDEKCWTYQKCAAFSKNVTGGVIRGDAANMTQQQWEETRSPYCSDTKSGTAMRFCYAESTASIDLNVDIGSFTSASDIGEYIAAAYSWLIPAAALIAVTMMMIGGLQYAIARGKSSYIDKGKKRITNAIAGLVLLLSAYVITKLIDPRLVSFEPLKTPLIKEVTMLSAEQTCSTLADNGFTIQSSGETSCGDKGTITSMENVKANVSTGTWKVGDTCDYSFCPNDASCMSDGECKLCGEITTPSTAVCSQAQKLNSGSDGETQVFCTYDATTNSCFSALYPGMQQGFTCAQLRAYDSAHHTGCATYTEVLYLDWSSGGSRSISSKLDSSLGGILQSVCENDSNTCRLYELNGEKSCQYSRQLESKMYGLYSMYVARCEGSLK